jgi:hypothetical protein
MCGGSVGIKNPRCGDAPSLRRKASIFSLADDAGATSQLLKEPDRGSVGWCPANLAVAAILGGNPVQLDDRVNDRIATLVVGGRAEFARRNRERAPIVLSEQPAFDCHRRFATQAMRGPEALVGIRSCVANSRPRQSVCFDAI